MPFALTTGIQGAWLLPALGLGAFLLLAVSLLVSFDRYLPGKGAFVSIAAIAAGFALFFPIAREVLAGGLQPTVLHLVWADLGFARLSWDLRVDPLAVNMLGIVTFVALMVQVYSLGYLRGDPRFTWYYAVHSLFCAAMLTLVLADSLLLLYVAWELVGLCSYLLIGYWWERPAAAQAAKKAFVTTRVGDVGLLVGILLLFRATGTFQLSEIFHLAEAGQLDRGLLTWASLLIFAGAAGKSAQFPFHVWLPDAMEGPTPVSALIHAATMVAAGVYLTARIMPLFAAADPSALLVVAEIGLITAVLGATIAVVQTDIKRVLAYSTVSQLGFMILALGAGAVTAAMFHLTTHAFFKALLFLGAGSVIHSTGTQDIRQMGGLLRRMPLTGGTFILASLALAGLPPLSGFFSKDEVLAAVLHSLNPAVYVFAALTAVLSAFYMARLCYLVFFGQPRDHSIHPHESPAVMTVPLVLLAVPAALGGLIAVPEIGRLIGLPGGYGSVVFAHGHPEDFHLDPLVAGGSFVGAIAGIVLATGFYLTRIWSPERVARALRPLPTVLERKYGFDELYQWGINQIVLVIGEFIAAFDRIVVNDGGINGPGQATVGAGYWLKFTQTGKLFTYATWMVAGTVLLAGAMVLALMSG